MPTTKEILEKYTRKLEGQIPNKSYSNPSQEYIKFKQDMSPETSRYERIATTIGNIISLKIAEKDRIKIQKNIDDARLDVTPSQVVSLAICSLILILFASFLITLGIYFFNNNFQFLFLFLGILTSISVFYITYTMPKRLANSWRLQASAQMVPAVLYVVIYMKHTSNLERAVAFASEHIEGPLALDFKKIFYDVEIGRYSTIKESLDKYLETWKDYAPEFIESFHLIESSLFEPSESRRIEILEKSLQTILDGIYEKMLKYSREIRSPLTNIYMLGIILPTLALAMLPMASTLLGNSVNWVHFMVIFNIIIPIFVFYLASEALLKRPGGYGESSILKYNPEYSKFISKKPWIKALYIALPLFIIGLIPFILQVDFITNSLNINSDYKFSELGLGFLGDSKLFDFKQNGSETIGPFGVGAVIFSMFIPLSIIIFFSTAYKLKTKDLIKSRDNTKKLEEEFTNSLFQLGNRLGDGVPAEIVFSKVAESTQGLETQQFFSLVNQNIQQSGMSLEEAMFNKKRGALIFFPSPLIATSMKILIESVKKGLQVAARSLMSISEYLKNIHKINQRLRDILAEIVSDMRSNMTFLAPLLAGIVIGLGTMVTTILNKISIINSLGSDSDVGGIGSFASIASIFNINEVIPPYHLQIIVSIYIIEIIFILSSALVTVESGKDTLKEKNSLAKNLRAGGFLYIIAGTISIVALTLLASIALGSVGS